MTGRLPFSCRRGSQFPRPDRRTGSRAAFGWTAAATFAALAIAATMPLSAQGSSPAPSAAGAASSSAAAQAAPPAAARSVVADAVKRAAAEKKVVLVEFGASWCVWCRSFEAFVHAPETARTISDNFVLVNLTVDERNEKKALENPGGVEVLTEWDGFDAGLPFYVFLDAKGEKIADSNVMRDGSNVGFPATKEELEAFMGLLEATAPRLTSSGRAALLQYLTMAIAQQPAQ